MQQLQAQVLVAEPRGARRHRDQRMPRHAGRGVDLEQVGLAGGRVDHHVQAAPAAAAQHPVGLEHDVLDRLLLARGKAAGDEILGVVGEVLVVVVVVALGRDDADHRQRAGRVARPPIISVTALDELLAQHVGIQQRGRLDRGDDVRIALDLGHADRRAFAGRLDDHGKGERVRHGKHVLARVAAARSSRYFGVGRPSASQTRLVADLVDRDGGRHHARAGVGNAEQLQRALHRAVLAEAAMQRDEAAIESAGLQFGQVPLGRIERVGVDAARQQRLQHAAAGHERETRAPC